MYFHLFLIDRDSRLVIRFETIVLSWFLWFFRLKFNDLFIEFLINLELFFQLLDAFHKRILVLFLLLLGKSDFVQILAHSRVYSW